MKKGTPPLLVLALMAAACSLTEAQAIDALGDGECGADRKACPVPGTLDGLQCVSILDAAYGCAVIGNCSPCTVPNGSASCGQDGTCTFETCDFGFVNCDGAAVADPCQTDVLTDPQNCSECGRQCPAVHGAAGCSNGDCTILCDPGFGNCNQPDQGFGDDDGCETPLTTNEHCGTCGTVCAGGTLCTGGACR